MVRDVHSEFLSVATIVKDLFSFIPFQIIDFIAFTIARVIFPLNFIASSFLIIQCNYSSTQCPTPCNV